ncbi:MAG: DUF4919 domain-containing protein [Bacteroides sp.]|nr:DUF4919 domain-containing protein [Bacteroides sp.]MCM1379106.1 DUF4919 domain-containing protein [Bacteroides sp.]MCM1445804.1 DUF4919 domain-containing protein [Prevotella sp.]
MKRIIPLILAGLALALMSLVEPVAPDMDQIREEVTNPTSKYYYPKLMAQYERNETIMTLDDFRRLYLGAMFAEDFNPYRTSPYAAVVEDLYFKSHHSGRECDEIIKYAQLSLQDDPFNLQQIDYLIYALREKKKNNLANIWQFRLNHILEAIVSTGTGLDPEHAWYVINPKHEYFLLNKMGRIATGFEFKQPWYDHISVEPKGTKDSTDYYFNSRYFLEQYRLKYPDDSDGADEEYGPYNN